MDIEKIGQLLANNDSPPQNQTRVNPEKFAVSMAQDLPSTAGPQSAPQLEVPASFSHLLVGRKGDENLTRNADQVISAYTAQAQPKTQTTKGMTGLQKYVDDQLLRNPGGHDYDLKEKKVKSEGPRSFMARVGKDLADAFDNLKNFFSNLFFGAKFCYRDENNQIREARHRGMLGSVFDFFKDLGSALSFGSWRPNGEAKPQGLVKRFSYSLSKLYQAFAGDLLGGVPGSVNHMANDLLLAGWNLAEAAPDATLGNIPAGEKLTSKVFDGGQVLIDYATDVIPSGDAWKRVHAFSIKEAKLPILDNLGKKERNGDDPRWHYVRNTKFRKIIETVGALLADVAAFGLSRWITGSSVKDKS
jgi:hypothetical protein